MTNIHVTDEPSAKSQEAQQFFFPNKMGRIILLSLEQVMGSNGVNAILNLARLQQYIGNYPPNNFAKEFSFDQVGQLLQALDEMYGPRGGRGLALRAGRACFKLGIQDFGPMLGIADLTFRILPLRMKLKVGLEVLAQMFNKFTDHAVRLGEDEQYYQWIIERCGTCWGRKCDAPCCHLAVGLLEEALYWVGGGENFYVEEITCIAAGDENCTILIGKQPLD
ncbi:MAG: 4-vinyl reductase [Chloroflexi bacterium]|nr:MAG: 4-vinyl reductase [Chloroflexota bacterium]